MSGVNPDIEWWRAFSNYCLKFTFRGHLSAEDAEVAIGRWRQAFEENADASHTLVWDCLQMEGYDHKARVAWTQALLELRSQIRSIWLITDSSIVKMGASVMGMFSTIDIHIVESETEIRQAHTPPPPHFIPNEVYDDPPDTISY